MITVRVNEKELSIDCEGTKDFKDITNNENLEKIKKFAKVYNDEVVKPRMEAEKQAQKESQDLCAEYDRKKSELDIKMAIENDKIAAKGEERYTLLSIVRKTGSAIGITSGIVGIIKIANKFFGFGESDKKNDHKADHKVEAKKPENKPEPIISKKKK